MHDARLRPTTSLSVLVPVYNERYLVAASLRRLEVLASAAHLDRIEVIVVDDGSTDGTAEVLDRFRSELPSRGRIAWTFLRHEQNQGKGSAIRTALAKATCEITVVHDADLEYHPEDLVRMTGVVVDESADAVLGSRFAGGEVRRVLLYRHQLGNRLVTLLCNLVTNLNLTDVECGYKAIRTALLQSIPLVSDDFRIEPELVIKLAKRGARVFEVPISYSGRTHEEGKKIGWRDGVLALWAILRFAFSDRIYKEDEYGSHILARLSRAPRFNAWMADVIRPYCGDHVLEIGSGVGNLTLQMVPRRKYVASDINPLYLQTLANLQPERPYLETSYCDVTDLKTFPREQGPYDSVICLNVVEHVEDDEASLRNIASVLAPGGKAIVLVPQGQWNFGTLDQVLGHKRRYHEQALRGLAERCGLLVREVIPFNRVGTIAWFLNGRVLRRRTFGLGQVMLLNALTPIFRLVDGWLPVPPLSLIGVFERAGATQKDAGMEQAPVAQASLSTPSPEARRASVLRSLLGGLALLAAGLIGLVPPLTISRAAERPHGPDRTSVLEGELARLRPAIRSGARVGILVDLPKDLEQWYLAQYALAPAVLLPISRTRCLDQGTPGCAGGVEYLIDPRGPSDGAFRSLGGPGFTLALRSGPFALLARSRP